MPGVPSGDPGLIKVTRLIANFCSIDRCEKLLSFGSSQLIYGSRVDRG